MEKLLEEMIDSGMTFTWGRVAEGGEKTCRITCDSGTTRIGKGSTLLLAMLSGLGQMVSVLEGYLAEAEQERDQARDLLHRNGLVVNMLDEREVAAMRRVYPFADRAAE